MKINTVRMNMVYDIEFSEEFPDMYDILDTLREINEKAIYCSLNVRFGSIYVKNCHFVFEHVTDEHLSTGIILRIYQLTLYDAYNHIIHVWEEGVL